LRKDGTGGNGENRGWTTTPFRLFADVKEKVGRQCSGLLWQLEMPGIRAFGDFPRRGDKIEE
jgi:hypothetical protein